MQARNVFITRVLLGCAIFCITGCSSLSSIPWTAPEVQGRSLVVVTEGMRWLQGVRAYLLPSEDEPPVLVVRGINRSRFVQSMYLRAEWLNEKGQPMVQGTDWTKGEVQSRRGFEFRTRAPQKGVGDFRVYITDSVGAAAGGAGVPEGHVDRESEGRARREGLRDYQGDDLGDWRGGVGKEGDSGLPDAEEQVPPPVILDRLPD